MPNNRPIAADTAPNGTGRRCAKCERVKPEENFHWRRTNICRESYCKPCMLIYQMLWREQHPRVRRGEQREKYLIYQKQYNATPEARQRRNMRQQTPIGKLMAQRTTVRRRLREKPTERLRQAEADLSKEIERLRGKLRGE